MASRGNAMSPTATAALPLLSDHPGQTVLPKLLMRRLNVERWEAINALRELSKAGYGEFVLGRRGGETRLEPNASQSNSGAEPPVAVVKHEIVSHEQTYLLRREKPVLIRVPADLTRVEAEKLAKWLSVIADDGVV